MSNLPINNFAPMTNTYLPQDRETPVVDKARDPLLSKPVANTLLPANTVESKGGNITMNRATFDQLFDILESIFKAVRLWAGQGGVPKSMPDAGALPKATSEAELKAPVLKDAAAKMLPKADVGAKVTPEADPKTQLLKDIVAQTLPKADAATKVTPEADSKAQFTAKILPDAAVMPRAMPEAKPLPQVIPGNELKVSPDAVAVIKKLSGEVPEIRLDAAQQSKQTSDINLTVQVVNCGLHHPEVSIHSHKLTLDDQSMVLPKTPVKPKADDQRPSVPNTLDKPKADDQRPTVPNTLDKPKADDKFPVGPNTPNTPMLNDQPLDFTPDIRAKQELTAPGPADERSGDVFRSRSRNRFDNLWNSNADRQSRA